MRRRGWPADPGISQARQGNRPAGRQGRAGKIPGDLDIRVSVPACSVRTNYPNAERAKGPFGQYAKLLKSDKNDIVDAELVSLGARCGFRITQDSNLRERIEFLYARKVCRIQAFDFAFIEASWNAPNFGRP